VLWVDDKLPTHPKILKAGGMIGENGVPLALAMFVEGLAYAVAHVTDGFIPDAFVSKSVSYSDPLVVARALTNRHVRLWKRVRGGYEIHDFHDWNKSKSEIMDLREKWRAKKAAQRRGGNGQFSGGHSRESQGDNANVPRGVSRESHRPLYLYVPRTSRSRGTGTSTVSVQTARVRVRNVENLKTKTKTPTHRVLCSMLSTELDADPSVANAIEGTKARCARQGFAYPDGDRLDAAVQAVARRRRIA
jgi:hypothetical protein